MARAAKSQTLGAWARIARRRVLAALASPATHMTAQERLEIENEIHAQAQFSALYGFMLVSACGIAVLGLLQSSVAVVIGAMLISPLMGPILSMGMAVARIEPRAFRTAAVTLASGAVLSVAAAAIIVWIAPLKDVTPEILARVRPTLLDLIVAVLSGFVGAYLTINRRAGTIAGVAIATALMPPLAVVGFGLATASWSIAGGALLLFLTNVVAILAAVFAVARRYGFAPAERDGPAWEVWALGGVIGLLAVPLALSLRGIVLETRETGRVRYAIEQVFHGAGPHITELRVRTKAGSPPDVQCVVITRRYVSDAATRVAQSLEPGARIVIEQVVAAQGQPAAATLAERASANLPASAEDRVRAMVSQAGQVVSIQRGSNGLTVQLVLPSSASLADYRAIEDSVQRLTPGETVAVLPPIQPLPPVAFDRGRSALSPAGEATVDLIAWAAGRWGGSGLHVEGRASANPRGRRPIDERLARLRAESVAERLRTLGVSQVTTSFTVADPSSQDDPEAWIALVTLERAAAGT